MTATARKSAGEEASERAGDEKPEERVLFVDDDRNLLDSMKRTFRKAYRLSVACGGEQALKVLDQDGPFAVVVSDYKMPGMDGIEFLAKVREEHRDIVRMMLTGNADLQSAVNAVNKGEIFRFLLKPCASEDLKAGIDAAIRQYRLVMAERFLLERTLQGSIQVLADVLSMVNPMAFGRATRVRSYVRQMAAALALPNSWKYETAALLSQIGMVAVPSEVLEKRSAGQELTEEQQRMLERHPEVGRELLAKIPRLEKVAEMIGWQAYPRKLETVPLDKVPLGSRILRIAMDFDALISQGNSRNKALGILASKPTIYDQAFLQALDHVEIPGQDAVVKTLAIRDFRLGMILDQDICHANGSLVVAKGNKITTGMLERLRNFADLGVIRQPIRVRVPRVRN